MQWVKVKLICFKSQVKQLGFFGEQLNGLSCADIDWEIVPESRGGHSKGRVTSGL